MNRQSFGRMWLTWMVLMMIPTWAGAWPVPDTGQTQILYTGDDGTYTINPPSFTVHDNGTVTDNVTGLLWQQQHDGVGRTWAEAITYCEGLTTLGGLSGWRLPTAKELMTLANLDKYAPAIDDTIFSGSSDYFWSSTINSNDAKYAWRVNFYHYPPYMNWSFDGIYGQSVYYVDSLDRTRKGRVRCVLDSSPVVWPSSPLIINNAFTATDMSAGLAWQRQEDGGKKNWQKAISYCKGLTLDGNSNWRLPTVNEMLSVVDYTKQMPAMDQAVFPGAQPSRYWSSSTLKKGIYYVSNAWYVSYDYGSADYDTYTDQYGLPVDNSHFVRCVTNGPVNSTLGAISILSPKQATAAVPGESLDIVWDAKGLSGQVEIALSRAGGEDGTWETIATTTANDGVFEWIVSGPDSADCVIKVTPLAASDLVGYQGFFSIVNQKLVIVPTVIAKFTTYDLVLGNKFSTGITMPIDPAAAIWSVSDSGVAALNGSILAAKKSGWVTVSAQFQGQTAAQTLFLIDPLNPDDWEGINDTEGQADPLLEGSFLQGQILMADQDWYTFTLDKSAPIAIGYASASLTADVNIDLVDVNGTAIATAISTDGSVQTMRQGLKAGTYFLRLSPVGDIDENEFYTLAWGKVSENAAEAELNNTADTATPLSKNLSIQGWLMPGDADYFALSLAIPSLLRFTLTSESTTADYSVVLFKKGNEDKPLDQVAIVNGQEALWDLGLASGDYLLKVTGIDPDTLASYMLTWLESPVTGVEIEPNDTLVTANGLVPSASREGRISYASDVDLFGFTLAGSSESLVKLTLTPEGNTANYGLELVNGIGTQLASKMAYVGATAFVQMKLPAGTYYLRVKGSGTIDPLARYSVDMTTTAQVTALAKLMALAVSAVSDSLAVDQVLPLAVTAAYSDATSLDVTAIADFTSSDSTVLTVDASGQVKALKKGHATVTASYQGKAATLPLNVGTPQAEAKQSYGNLIIIAGGSLSPSDSLKDATLHLSEMAYQKFQARNFEDEDIYFMSQTTFHDLNGDGYDDGIVDDKTPSTSEVVAAITDWAKAQSSSGPLYLYQVDHGAKQQFQVAPGQILTATQLKAALDSFQKDTGRPVVVFIEACYSGSFVEPLQNSAYDRLVLTSVDDLNPAYLSTDGTTSYSAFMLANLYKGKSIADSLALVKYDLTTIGMPYKKMAPQIEGKESLKSLKVGGDFALAGIFPELKNNTQSQSITAGSTLNMTTEATSMLGGLSVWTVIIPPDYTPPEVSGDFVSVVDELPKVALVDEDPTTKMMDGVYVGSYADFTYNGDYTVIFYVKDNENNLVKSAPVTISVSGGADVPTTTTTSTTTTSTLATEATTTTESSTTTTSTTEESATTTVEPTTTSTISTLTTETTTSSATEASSTTTTTIPASKDATLFIAKGWSLLSSTVNIQASSIFGDTQKYTSVWKWTDNSKGGKTWAVYLSGGDGGVSYANSKGFMPLTSIESGEGFWVNGKTDEQVQVNGIPSYGELSLTSGWNLVGVKGTNSMAVTELGEVTSVWKWTTVNGNKTWAVNLPGSDDKGAAYASSKGFGTFTTVDPGEGFWVNK